MASIRLPCRLPSDAYSTTKPPPPLKSWIPLVSGPLLKSSRAPFRIPWSSLRLRAPSVGWGRPGVEYAQMAVACGLTLGTPFLAALERAPSRCLPQRGSSSRLSYDGYYLAPCCTENSSSSYLAVSGDLPLDAVPSCRAQCPVWPQLLQLKANDPDSGSPIQGSLRVTGTGFQS